MNAMIILPFVIPAVVFVMLLALLIKERNAFFPKKIRQHTDDSTNYNKGNNRNDTDEHNWRNYMDFSGGMLGI